MRPLATLVRMGAGSIGRISRPRKKKIRDYILDVPTRIEGRDRLGFP